jgi:hypothetical protein
MFGTGLNLGSRRRQFPRRTQRFESRRPVRSIAKRLVLRLPAAAQPDGGPSGEVELLSFLVVNRELALDPNRAVVVDGDLR